MKLFLKIFFSLPLWLLRCMTFQKSTVINNQMLDFQTQIFIGLQSLQVDSFDDPNSFDSAQEIREFMIEGLPLSSKPNMPIKTKDYVLQIHKIAILATEKPWARYFGCGKTMGALFWLRKNYAHTHILEI